MKEVKAEATSESWSFDLFTLRSSLLLCFATFIGVIGCSDLKNSISCSGSVIAVGLAAAVADSKSKIKLISSAILLAKVTQSPSSSAFCRSSAVSEIW